MNEVVIVPTFRRPEFLHLCLRRIRQADARINISIFPDRGTARDGEMYLAVQGYSNFRVNYVPPHDYYGNTFNVMEAFRTVFNEGWDRVYYVEDDVMVHPNFFDWHRQMHDEWDEDGIFAVMAWPFNRHTNFQDDVLFQRWYYSIGTSFNHKQLSKIAWHASPFYYRDMPRYIEKVFADSKLNCPFGISHFEQDGLIQRIIEAEGTPTLSPGIGKCDHIGALGYNQGWKNGFFDGCKDFLDRVKRIEDFLADPYWRATVFDRAIVEREIGHELPKREFRYDIELPGGWSTEYVSELESAERLPRRINSVPLPQDAKIVLRS